MKTAMVKEKIEHCLQTAKTCGRFVSENPVPVIGWGILLAVILPLMCSKLQQVMFKSPDVGYELLTPRGWAMAAAADKKAATFTKKKKFTANAVIKIEAELGNPYGTLTDYMYGVVISQIRNEFEIRQQKTIQFTQFPTEEYRDEVPWVRCSFYIEADSLYEVFITTSNDYVVIIRFESHGAGKENDQRDFYKMLGSFRLFHVSHKNYFQEAVKGQGEQPAPKKHRGAVW